VPAWTPPADPGGLRPGCGEKDQWRRRYGHPTETDREARKLAYGWRCSRSTAFAAIAAQRQEALRMLTSPEWPRGEDGVHLEPVGRYSVRTPDGRDELVIPWVWVET
jgi:hypothetical protein